MESEKSVFSRIAWAGLAVFCWAAVMVAPVWGGKADNTLNIALEKEVESLDWYFNTAREGIVLSRHVYDHLIYRDPETFAYKPLLATSWKWISNTVLEMELRKGVTFHNGAKFSADDVVYMLNWVSNPENKVKQQNYVNWIKACKKINDYKIQIILHKPFPPALEFLSCADPIYPKDYYAKVGPNGFGVKPVGTGPYKVTEVEPGKKIVLEANENYFADSPKGKPSIKKIVWRTIPEVNTKVAELMTGGLDWAWNIPPDQAEKLAQVPDLKMVAAETMRIGFLMMDAANVSKDAFKENPFLKRKVRQAVNYAINREAIVKNLVGGQSRIIDSACYPSQFGCTQEVTKYEYNPDKARQLLAEAGYPNGFETTLNGYRDRPYAEAMANDLAKVGIKAKLAYYKYSALREKIRAGNTQFDFYTWGSYSINDVSAILSYYFVSSAEDMSRDPKVKELLEAGDSEMDATKRKAFYAEALKIIADEAYWAPLFTWVNNNCFSKDLVFTPYPDGVPRFFLAKWK
jgi:peptide/nickel transport system substrate-binding protein